MELASISTIELTYNTNAFYFLGFFTNLSSRLKDRISDASYQISDDIFVLIWLNFFQSKF